MMYYTSSSDDEPEIETLDISNDQYYRPVPQPNRLQQDKQSPKVCEATRLTEIPKYGSKKIRHSLPAYDLWKPFYPTYLSETKYRNFHRPKLRHYNNGPQAATNAGYPEYPIKSLSRHIFRKHRAFRTKVVKAISEDSSRDEIVHRFLTLKNARELTAKSGELYLFEYCEEFPPVLGQVGMASVITTYSYETTTRGPAKLKPKQLSAAQVETNTQSLSTCDLAKPKQSGESIQNVHTLGTIGYNEAVKSEKHSKQVYFHPLKPNSKIQVIENNLYRAPIYKHELSRTDFVIIRTRNSFYVRPAGGVFTVGQTMPLTIIPSPTEQQIQKFRCDLSNIHIHRLFKASNTRPPSLDLNRLLKLFPDYHKSVLMKRMRQSGADCRSLNEGEVFFQGTSNYGKMSLLDLRNMMRPELYCVNMSMLAARQRLRTLNYTESMIHPIRGQNSELEPEVLAAPWNTSRAVLSALKSQSYLDFKAHLIDPTGSREGFSCVPWSKSPIADQQLKDLRASTGVKPPPGLIMDLPSFKNPLQHKIVQEKLNRLAIYHKEAQIIFEIQSSSLALEEAVTSDEDDEGEDIDEDNENISDDTFNQQVEDLNRLVIGNRTAAELNYEKEEEVRRQMLADFKVDELKNRTADQETDTPPTKSSQDFTASTLKDKIMMITRTYEYGGRKIERTEIVREPRIIALYVKQKGGSVKTKLDHANLGSGESGDQADTSIISTRSEGATTQNRFRPRASSLGPSELCRADGTTLRISKRVLDDIRPMRHCRR